MINITAPIKHIHTYAASQSTEISKEYYNMLIGSINNGEIYKAICRIEDKRFYNSVRYFLISDR